MRPCLTHFGASARLRAADRPHVVIMLDCVGSQGGLEGFAAEKIGGCCWTVTLAGRFRFGDLQHCRLRGGDEHGPTLVTGFRVILRPSSDSRLHVLSASHLRSAMRLGLLSGTDRHRPARKLAAGTGRQRPAPPEGSLSSAAGTAEAVPRPRVPLVLQSLLRVVHLDAWGLERPAVLDGPSGAT